MLLENFSIPSVMKCNRAHLTEASGCIWHNTTLICEFALDSNVHRQSDLEHLKCIYIQTLDMSFIKLSACKVGSHDEELRWGNKSSDELSYQTVCADFLFLAGPVPEASILLLNIWLANTEMNLLAIDSWRQRTLTINL